MTRIMDSSAVATIATGTVQKPEAKASLGNRSVQVISATSTAAFTGGAVAASILSGPIGLIIGLATAAFISLAAFIKAIVSFKHSVTNETAQKPTALTPDTTPAKAIEQKQTRIQKMIAAVRAHPYKTAFALAAVAAAVVYGRPVAVGVARDLSAAATTAKDAAVSAKDTIATAYKKHGIVNSTKLAASTAATAAGSAYNATKAALASCYAQGVINCTKTAGSSIANKTVGAVDVIGQLNTIQGLENASRAIRSDVRPVESKFYELKNRIFNPCVPGANISCAFEKPALETCAVPTTRIASLQNASDIEAQKPGFFSRMFSWFTPSSANVTNITNASALNATVNASVSK